MQGFCDIFKLINVIHYTGKLKDKSHNVIPTDAEKAFDKIQQQFVIKILQKMSIEESYLNIVKAIYDKAIENIILNGEKFKAFPLRSGVKQGCTLSSLIFSIVMEVLATAIREEKEIKETQIRKEVKLYLQ